MTSSRSEDGMTVARDWPISTVRIGAWGEGGKPMPITTSAVCDRCGEWAFKVCVAGHHTERGDLVSDSRVSRTEQVCVYTCDLHYEEVMEELLDKYGWASNRYERDDLVEEVSRLSVFKDADENDRG